MEEIIEMIKAKPIKQKNELPKLLDTETRKKRKQDQIESLEKDNFKEVEIQATNTTSKTSGMQNLKDPTSSASAKKKKKGKTGDHYKQRFRKTFNSLLEDLGPEPNYVSCCAPVSVKPTRKLCTVCVYKSVYKCVSCGVCYCSIQCLGIHKDTRCMKWVV